MRSIDKRPFDGDIVEQVTELRPRVPTPDFEPSYSTVYFVVPLLLAAVALLGGVRFSSPANEFVFNGPSLFSLILSVLSIALFARSGVLSISDWTRTGSRAIATIANFVVILLLFAATAQTYNSVLPERGFLLWTVGIFLIWNIWTNLLADLGGRRLILSFISSIGLAFVVKYLILAGMTASGEGTFIERWWNDPGKQAMTWALDLPRYSDATGYLQFFVILAMAAALYLLPSRPPLNDVLPSKIDHDPTAIALDGDAS